MGRDPRGAVVREVRPVRVRPQVDVAGELRLGPIAVYALAHVSGPVGPLTRAPTSTSGPRGREGGRHPRSRAPRPSPPHPRRH